MHHSDLIVVEGRLAKTQADLSNETRRREGLERRINEAIPELTRLRAENERLRAALEPFARWANQMDSPPNWVPDGCPIIASPGDITDFCVGMLRRARAALAGKEQENASSQT